MDLISYETPEIVDDGILKPYSFEMASFLYNQLSNDRRFEELIYSLYKSEIQNNQFGGFTGISLMNGVRDKGSDCCLTINGKNHGLIQCKKYLNNYGKEEFGLEITKFVLYYLLENILIADLNNFTYFIAVSKGFVSTCDNFIKAINQAILTETNLDLWISTNLKSPTLKILELGNRNIRTEVLNVLTKIKVEKIIPQDLDILLLKEYNSTLSQLFFAIRTITDNTVLEKGLKRIEELHNKQLSTSQLKQELKTGSFTISAQNNTIEGIPDSHIERSETTLLFDWLTQPCEIDGQPHNICLLVGGAGYGKTVIIKDLYEKLNAQNIPSLALKADKLYVSSFRELQEKINLSVPLNEFIDQCKQQFEMLVIIIDQIDALSQSLSSNRSFLDTYISLIEGYKHDPIVRIIISVRYFDLLYDPALRIYKNLKTIEVKILSIENVNTQLRKIGIADKGITDQLLELLRIPNNLDVFSRIYNTSGNFAGINSLQGLYAELWKIKILQIKEIHNLSNELLKETLFLLAGEMYKNQQISVSETGFEDYTNELKYLLSEQIVLSQGKDLQFFHQSFYDYVFSRRFVETRSSIFKYLKQENQSILVRAALKMILNYLREVDAQSYFKQIKALLGNKTIRFHIHHLILSTIAAVEAPSSDEKILVNAIVKGNQTFFITFCEHSSNGWISYFMSSGLIDEMLFSKKKSYFVSQFQKIWKSILHFGVKPTPISPGNTLENLGIIMLQRNISREPEIVLPYLKKLTSKEVVINILYYLDDWNRPEAIALLESFGQLPFADWRYSKILEDLVAINPTYVFEKIKDFLIDSDSHNQNDQHRKENLLDKLFEFLPEPTFNFIFQYFIDRIESSKIDYESKPLIKDYIIYDINFDREHLHGNSFLFQQLLNYLKEAANANNPFYQSFLAVNLSSPYLAVHRAILYSYSGNEKNQCENILKTFNYLNSINALNSYDILSDSLRLLLKVTFPYLKKGQAKQILDSVAAIPFSDYYIHTYEGKKYRVTFFGLNRYRYMLCIPLTIIEATPQLKKEFYELKRRYYDKGILQSRESHGGMVKAPLSENAYSKMSLNDWQHSFNKFNEERGMNTWGDDFLKGGLSEHALAFKNSVKKNPERFIPLIDCLFKDFSISIEYHINGIEALTEVNYDTAKILEFLKVLIKQELKPHSLAAGIRIANYLIRNDIYDREVFNYLVFKALNDIDPEIDENNPAPNGEHLLSKGLYSVRGAAAHALTFVQSKEYEQEVFQTLTQIANQDTLAVVAAMLHRFAYLMNLNRDRAFELFISIINRKDYTFLIETTWSLSYFVNYDFQRFLPYFNRILQSELTDIEAESFGNILFGAYYHDYENAKELLDKLLIKCPKIRSKMIRNAVQYTHLHDSSLIKSLALLEKYVLSEDKEIHGAFHIAFLHMDHIEFKEILPFLKKYTHTQAISGSEYFLEYLLSHCHTYPDECITLFEIVVNNSKSLEHTDIYHHEYEEHAVNLIIGIYNSLRPQQNPKHKKHQQKLLTLFDATLRDVKFKSNTDKLLDKIIY